MTRPLSWNCAAMVGCLKRRYQARTTHGFWVFNSTEWSWRRPEPTRISLTPTTGNGVERLSRFALLPLFFSVNSCSTAFLPPKGGTPYLCPFFCRHIGRHRLWYAGFKIAESCDETLRPFPRT